ncbi:MAG: tetratricopeptide repeat protein [Synechococcaceae cyanobacterium SM2_3_2]|nr:tetratricopeptide repeat protein [Synechococcaceae cyanobacterium SM2_3_2]
MPESHTTCPQDGRTYGILGLTQCRLKQWTDGIKNLTQGIRYSPQELWIRLNLIWALIATQQLAPAENQLTPLLSKYPQNPEILALEAYLSSQKEDWKLTIRYCRQTLHYASQSDEYSHIEAQLYLYLSISLLRGTTRPGSQDFARCIQDFTQKFCSDPVSWALLGWHFATNSRFTEAIKALNEAQKLGSAQLWVLHTLSLAQAHNHQLEPALANLKIYLQQNPRDSGSLALAGLLSAQLNQWQEAKTNLQQSLRVHHQDPQTLHNLGWVCLNLRRQQDSSDLAKQMISSYKQAHQLYLANHQVDYANRVHIELTQAGIQV